jgi:hypothetical protein
MQDWRKYIFWSLQNFSKTIAWTTFRISRSKKSMIICELVFHDGRENVLKNFRNGCVFPFLINLLNEIVIETSIWNWTWSDHVTWVGLVTCYETWTCFCSHFSWKHSKSRDRSKSRSSAKSADRNDSKKNGSKNRSKSRSTSRDRPKSRDRSRSNSKSKSRSRSRSRDWLKTERHNHF